MSMRLVSIPWDSSWPQSDPFTLYDTPLTIADAAMIYCDRHPRPAYYFGKGIDNPSPINPHESSGVDQIEEMIGKGTTKDIVGPGTLEVWQRSWSVYCTLADNVEKGSIVATNPVYLANRKINPVMTEIPLSALLDLARRRGDAASIVSSLLTWYEPAQTPDETAQEHVRSVPDKRPNQPQNVSHKKRPASRSSRAGAGTLKRGPRPLIRENIKGRMLRQLTVEEITVEQLDEYTYGQIGKIYGASPNTAAAARALAIAEFKSLNNAEQASKTLGK